MRTLEHYQAKATTAFGDARDPIDAVAKRAEQLFDRPVIVWEGDAQTFEFSFVSEGAERLLGHPSERWIREATFWTDSVVHPDDRDEAVAYCALATARCRDHAFVYRATTLDGRVLWLSDYVQVVLGAKRIAQRLRGIMIDVTDLHAVSSSEVDRWVSPPREQLDAAR